MNTIDSEKLSYRLLHLNPNGFTKYGIYLFNNFANYKKDFVIRQTDN